LRRERQISFQETIPAKTTACNPANSNFQAMMLEIFVPYNGPNRINFGNNYAVLPLSTLWAK
jgi:hypothetical protein